MFRQICQSQQSFFGAVGEIFEVCLLGKLLLQGKRLLNRTLHVEQTRQLQQIIAVGGQKLMRASRQPQGQLRLA